jgi:DNA-binding YbaB/EbfC family protein
VIVDAGPAVRHHPAFPQENHAMATGFGDMSSLLKQAQEMQRRMADTQRSLGERILEGSAGGGAVKAYVNGNQELQAVKIQKAAVDPTDVDTLEDLVTAAVRQALQAAKELRDREMGKVTGGMNLPGMGF